MIFKEWFSLEIYLLIGYTFLFTYKKAYQIIFKRLISYYFSIDQWIGRLLNLQSLMQTPCYIISIFEKTDVSSKL